MTSTATAAPSRAGAKSTTTSTSGLPIVRSTRRATSRGWRTTTCFGTPDQCIERIRRLRDDHHVHYFGANMSFGTLEHEKVMRSMELFAKEVMPAFQ